MPTENKNKNKTICAIRFYRQNGTQCLELKVDKALEDLFRTVEKKRSGVYKDVNEETLRYYAMKEELDRYTSRVSMVTLKDYGTKLYIGGGYNFSILRTVGLSRGKTFIVNDLVLEDEVANWITRLGDYLKFLYTNFIVKSEIRANIVLEL